MNNNQNPNFNKNQPPRRPDAAPQKRPAGTQNPSNTQNIKRVQNPNNTQNLPRPQRAKAPENSGSFRPVSPRKKWDQNDYLKWFLILAVVILVALVVTYCIIKLSPDKPEKTPDGSGDGSSIQAGLTDPDENNGTTVPEWAVVPSDVKAFIPKTTSSTVTVPSGKLHSAAAIMVDMKSGTVISELNPDTIIFPASLTKIMTVIVACENITDMNDTFTLTSAMLAPLDAAGLSQAYFKTDTPIPMKDLIYGAILPSGADATLALALKISGSEAEFVSLMNKKALEIGCYKTHFTNASGLHDQGHYSTVRDMATIMAYAMNNTFLRKVLSAVSYDTEAGIRSGNGSNTISCIWKARLLGNESEKATLFAAKTGYTPEANQCLASVSRTTDGREYLIVTANASTDDGTSSKPLPYKDVKYLCDTYIK